MALKEQIQKDMIEAMKTKDDLKVGVLRMVKAAILKFETAGDRKQATDEDILNLIGKEAKQRQESAESFRTGGRPELAEKEDKEIAILKTYLPTQLSEEELKKIIQETISEVGATSKADMGKVMGALMPKIRGKADGGQVNKMVGELLS